MKKLTILFSLLFVLYACEGTVDSDVTYKISDDSTVVISDTTEEDVVEEDEENTIEEEPSVREEPGNNDDSIDVEKPSNEEEPISEEPSSEQPIIEEPIEDTPVETPEEEPVTEIYTITYNNSGTIATENYEEGTVITLSAAVSSINAQDRTVIPLVFLNWENEENGDIYSAGNTITIITNITLNAIYDTNVVGNETASGYIFYDKGFYSDGWRYIECAKTDNFTARWWDTIQYVFCGLDSTNTDSLQIGAGKSNSETIITNSGAFLYMAAGRLPSGWYLPSLGELMEIKTNLIDNGKGNFDAGEYYWSSNEVDLEKAYAMMLTSSVSAYQRNKYSNDYRVRGIRYF